MRCSYWLSLVLFGALLGGQPASAAPDGWHTSLKSGLEASAKSGKPLLLVTGWKSTV